MTKAKRKQKPSPKPKAVKENPADEQTINGPGTASATGEMEPKLGASPEGDSGTPGEQKLDTSDPQSEPGDDADSSDSDAGEGTGSDGSDNDGSEGERVQDPADGDVTGLVGSNIQPATFALADGTELQLGDVVRAAVARKEISAEDWNDLDDETREDLIQYEVDQLDLAEPIKAMPAKSPKPEYEPADPNSKIEILRQQLDSYGIDLQYEFAIDKAEVEHWNLTASVDRAGHTLHHTIRIDGNVTDDDVRDAHTAIVSLFVQS